MYIPAPEKYVENCPFGLFSRVWAIISLTCRVQVWVVLRLLALLTLLGIDYITAPNI